MDDEVDDLPVPHWKPHDPPGPIDVVVYWPHSPAAPRYVGHLKYKHTQHSLWDLFFMASAVEIDHVEASYMLCGMKKDHRRTGRKYSMLFGSGTWESALLRNLDPNEWTFLCDTSRGSHERLPKVVETEAVAARSYRRHGEEWELRCVAVWPRGGWVPYRRT